MRIVLLLFALISTLEATTKIQALFNSLDPYSLKKSLAFYELYPESDEGKAALLRASNLILVNNEIDKSIVSVINPFFQKRVLSDELVTSIEAMATHLPNRKLKGYQVSSEQEVIALASEEVDVGKALIFSQIKDPEEANRQARSYSALLDLMALQILAKVSLDSSPQEKITATNELIFDVMHFRFPPHSVYAQKIDKYTFLPSVMDDHLGVCLGVSALYLAIAQRIDLPLEAITPPGHIYLRYRNGDEKINIETTARGINIPEEHYLSLETPKLDVHTYKEVIGMTHINEGSAYLQQANYARAAQSYETALPYFKDAMVDELLGFCYCFTGRDKEGKELLFKSLEDKRRSLAADFLVGETDLEGIQAVHLHVDETRESIEKKKSELEKIVKKFPRFREGISQLAVCWLQLNRIKEALPYLERYQELDPSDPTNSYYLSVIYGMRKDYKNCWRYFNQTCGLVESYEKLPKALRELRRELTLVCPELTVLSTGN